jgi:hypothetical protein
MAITHWNARWYPGDNIAIVYNPEKYLLKLGFEVQWYENVR